MATSRGMVVVSGVTYRIIELGERYEIVRVLDDQPLGTFRCGLALEIGDGAASTDSVVAVAREAKRLGKLRWVPNEEPPPPSAVRTGDDIQRAWERALWAFIGSLVARFGRASDLLTPAPVPIRRDVRLVSARAHWSEG